jgi:excisionase family DNA binding protein
MRHSIPVDNLDSLEVATGEIGPHADGKVPFAERLTCSIAEACDVTGLGRTKLYELIGQRAIATTTVGRRRLVIIQSLRDFVFCG